MVQGGFSALHRFLVDAKRLKLLDGHVENKCIECNPAKFSSWVKLYLPLVNAELQNIVGKMKDAVISKSVSVKEKMSTLVNSPSVDAEIKHVVPADRHGKR